jgi:outer membrane protein assembly factor BamB
MARFHIGRWFVIAFGGWGFIVGGMDERLFIGTNGHVCAIDARSGQEVWRTRLQEGIMSATTAADVSVLVRDGVIYAGSQGHLFALSSAGEILWHNSLKGLNFNDISLAFEGQSVQFLQKTVRSSNSSSSS